MQSTKNIQQNIENTKQTKQNLQTCERKDIGPVPYLLRYCKLVKLSFLWFAFAL